MALTRVRVNQDSSGQITGTVLDAAGLAVAGSRVTSVLVTLWDLETYNADASPIAGIINGHQSEEVFAVSPSVLTIDEAGAFVWPLEPADNPIVTANQPIERHRAAFVFVFDTGHYELAVEVDVLRVAA